MADPVAVIDQSRLVIGFKLCRDADLMEFALKSAHLPNPHGAAAAATARASKNALMHDGDREKKEISARGWQVDRTLIINGPGTWRDILL